MSKIISQNFLWKKDVHLLIVFKAQKFTISADKGASNVSISKVRPSSNITDFMLGIHGACIYDDWFYGNVIEIFEQYSKIHVKFMKKNGKCFLLPTEYYQIIKYSQKNTENIHFFKFYTPY